MLRAKLHQNVLLSFIFIQALSSVWPWEGSLSQPHLLLQVDTYQRPPIQGSCPPWAGRGGRVEGEDGNRSGPPSPLMSQPPQLSSWVSNLAKNFTLHSQSRQGWCAKPQKDQHSTFSELWLLANSFHTSHASLKPHQEGLEDFPVSTFLPKPPLLSPPPFSFSAEKKLTGSKPATAPAGNRDATSCFPSLLTLEMGLCHNLGYRENRIIHPGANEPPEIACPLGQGAWRSPGWCTGRNISEAEPIAVSVLSGQHSSLQLEIRATLSCPSQNTSIVRLNTEGGR